MVTTVTTVTSIAAIGFASVMSIAAVVTLILFLSAGELTGAGQSPLSRLISRFLKVGIIPLVMVFAAIVVVRIIEVLA